MRKNRNTPQQTNNLDHDADAETHEWFAEINNALSVSNDSQRCYGEICFLQRVQ